MFKKILKVKIRVQAAWNKHLGANGARLIVIADPHAYLSHN